MTPPPTPDTNPEKKQFTITYVLNGGTYDGSTADIKEVYDEGEVISIHAAPTREGYNFTYWKGSEYKPGDSYTVTEDHTFTAQWEQKTKPSDNPPPSGTTTPKTGDDTNVTPWIVLLALSVLAVIAALILYTVRRKRIRK